MRIAIIGAGVVGVTTAYTLAKAGHEVTVFDREPRAAMESSFANGGQLSYGFASPMATPALLGKLPNIFLGRDIGFRLPTTFSLEFLAWSLRFLGHCAPSQSKTDSTSLSLLAVQSGIVFKQILSETNFDFGHRKSNKLVLLPKPSDVEKARIKIDPKNGSENRIVSWEECLELESSLKSYNGKAAGGLWIPGDEVGDAARFSQQMVEFCENAYRVKFRFNNDVDNISVGRASNVCLTVSSGKELPFDSVVLCTGVAGKRLINQLGIRMPIYPVIGYSLTAPLGLAPPETAVTDSGNKIVYSRIGNNVRIAGFADFGTASEERRRQRVQDLVRIARKVIPEVADYDRIESTWVGARPATPNSLPIICASKVPDVYLNMGHGMFGWTLSAGAAQKIADLIGPARRVFKAA